MTDRSDFTHITSTGPQYPRREEAGKYQWLALSSYSLRKSTTYMLQGKSSCQSLAVKAPLPRTCSVTVVTNDYFLTTECKFWFGLLVQYEIIDCLLLWSICLQLTQVMLWEYRSVPNFIRCLCKEHVRTLVAVQAPSFLSWFDSGS